MSTNEAFDALFARLARVEARVAELEAARAAPPAYWTEVIGGSIYSLPIGYAGPKAPSAPTKVVELTGEPPESWKLTDPPGC